MTLESVIDPILGLSNIFNIAAIAFQVISKTIALACAIHYDVSFVII